MVVSRGWAQSCPAIAVAAASVAILPIVKRIPIPLEKRYNDNVMLGSG
jgi:hypothetical protein